jgi:hypothetical protein
LLLVLGASLQLGGESWRNKRVAINLTVGMVESYTNGFTLVLEDEYKLYKLQPSQLLKALGPNTHEFIDLLDRFPSERRRVVRAVQNNFAYSLSRANWIELRRNYRRLVWNWPQAGETIFKYGYIVIAGRHLRGKTARLRWTEWAVIIRR